MKPQYHFPVKPFRLNQAWGILNSIYNQFGFSRHNGIDFALGTDKTVRYPWSGTGTVVRVGDQPNGGGIFVGIMSNELYEFDDRRGARILSDFLHCEKLLVGLGDKVRTGDPIAVADNTGFSTGPHTHEQDRRVKTWNGLVGQRLQWAALDDNDANGSFDPLRYASLRYSEDIGTMRDLIVRLTNLVQRWVVYQNKQ